MGHLHPLSPLGMFLPSKRITETFLHGHETLLSGKVQIQISVILKILLYWLLVLIRPLQLNLIIFIVYQHRWCKLFLSLILVHTHNHTHILNQVQNLYYGQRQVQDFVQLTLNMRVICKTSDLGSHYNFPSYTFLGSFVSLLLDEEQSNENAQLLSTSSPHQPWQ